MSDPTTGMPFYWVGGDPNAAAAANLAQNQAAMAQQQQYFANQQALNSQNQGVVNQISSDFNTKGPSSGFGTVGGYPSFGEAHKSVFDTGAQAYQDYGNPALGAGQPDYFSGATQQTFNPTQYLSQNRDVWEAGADPWQHYNQFGMGEGRSGAFSDFNPYTYLQHNPDVMAAGMNPTAHWFDYGQKEGRQGTGDPFNQQEYLLQNRDVAAAGVDPFQHWMTYGAGEGREAAFGGTEASDWDSYFNQPNSRDAVAAAYLQNNPDIFNAAEASGQDPSRFALDHITNFGMGEGRIGFDADEYRRENPDVVAAGVDPWQHYTQYGQAEGRFSPMTRGFDPENYLLYNQDVADAGVDPWQHYTQYGLQEGRVGGFEEGGGYNSDPGFDTVGYFSAHPEEYKKFLVNADYTNPTAYVEMSNYQSPSNDYNTFQKGPSHNWQASIPKDRYDPNTINAVYQVAGQLGLSPAALASIINMESTWDPRKISPTGSYYGMTQMGAGTFADAGGRLGGLTYSQYKQATAAQQIKAYVDWINQGARIPGSAASLVKSGIGSLPVELQAAIMQGTQFTPNATRWVNDYRNGILTTPTAPNPGEQAGALGNTSLNAMRDVFASRMAAWPQSR